MTTVTEYSYSTDTIVSAHQAVVDKIDGGAGAGNIRIFDSADVLLAEIPLDDPCGTVNGTTGQITFTVTGTDESPTAGEAEYADFCDSDDNMKIRLPVQEGGAAVSGYAVINSKNILADTTVSVVSAVVG